jgi:hypothetical protein
MCKLVKIKSEGGTNMEQEQKKKKSILAQYQEFSRMLSSAEGNFKLTELLTDAFFQKYTQYQNMAAFTAAIGKPIDSVEDLTDVSDDAVWSKTNFKNTEEMLSKAVEEYVAAAFAD